jgi:hypothetical protein
METNLLCDIHNSPVGGVCSDTTCIAESQLMCIKCIVDSKSCIRAKGHKIISINEYFKTIQDSLNLNGSKNKEIIELYVKARQINISESVENVKKLNEQEKQNNEIMLKKFEEKLESLVKTESLKNEKAKIENLQKLEQIFIEFENQRKNLLKTINNEKLLEIQIGNYKQILFVFLQKFREKNYTLPEIQNKIEGFIYDVRNLLKLNNDENLNKLLDNITEYVSFISKPYETDISKFEKNYLTNFNKDIKLYFDVQDKAIHDFLNLSSSMNKEAGFKAVNAVKALISSNSSSKVSTSSSIKKAKSIYVKSKEIKLNDFIQNYQDEEAIYVPDTNILGLLFNNSFTIFNTDDKSIKLSLLFQKDEFLYQKKLYISDSYKLICLFTSKGELVFIDINKQLLVSQYNWEEFTNKVVNKSGIVFDVLFEKGKPISLIISQLKGPFIILDIAEGSKLLKLREYIEEIEEKIKINCFKAIYNKEGIATWILRASNLGLEIFYTHVKKYLMFTFKKKACLSFDYIDTGTDVIVYSLWATGVVNIYSLSKKLLIREIPVFIKTIPVYCITLFNEKKLFVGGDKRYYIIDCLDNKKTSKAVKLGEADEKVSNIIVHRKCGNGFKSFSCFTKNKIYSFKIEK